MTGPIADAPCDDRAQQELVDAILRATEAIDDETRALKRTSAIDFEAHRRRKDLCLLDLSRRSRIPPGPAPGPAARMALLRLKDAVIENQAVLKIHLAAARAVSDIMLRAIAEEESDRTYSQSVARRGYRV